MDKYEYNVKSDQIKKLYSRREFEAAATIADEIDWARVKDNTMINRVADIYENVKQYEKAKEVLLIAYERSPLGRQLAYKLTILALRTRNFVEADEFYQDFVEMSPSDVTQYLLKYRIAKAKGEDIEVLIRILEAYVEVEMDERWQYELAKLYHEAGMDDKCIAMCDELQLWFNDGKYVEKAKALKKLITGVMSEYEKRYADINTVSAGANSSSDKSVNEQDTSKETDGSNGSDEKSEDEDSNAYDSKNVASTIQEVEETDFDDESDTEFDEMEEDANDTENDEENEDVLEADMLDQESSTLPFDSSEIEEFARVYVSSDEERESEKEDGTSDSSDEEDDEFEPLDDTLKDEDESYLDDDIDDEESAKYIVNEATKEVAKMANAADYSNFEMKDMDAEGLQPIETEEERLANEALEAARQAAIEAQKAADRAKALVEEARERALQVKGRSTILPEIDHSKKNYSGMNAKEISDMLEKENLLQGNSDITSNRDSLIEIFEFDKEKDGKCDNIGEELTKTAEIDINEINIKLEEANNLYNTANIQAALAKSMEKILDDEKKRNEKKSRNAFEMQIDDEEDEIRPSKRGDTGYVEEPELEEAKAEETEMGEELTKDTEEVKPEEVTSEIKPEETSVEDLEESREIEDAPKVAESEVKESESEESKPEEITSEVEPEETSVEDLEESTEIEDAPNVAESEVKESESEESKPEETETVEELTKETAEEVKPEELTKEDVKEEATKVEPEEVDPVSKLEEKPEVEPVSESEEKPEVEPVSEPETEQEVKEAELKEVETEEVTEEEAEDPDSYLDDEDDLHMDYNKFSDDEPTKRINRDEINRILAASKNIYQTVPLSATLEKTDKDENAVAGNQEEEQIEGQMSIDDVLAEYEKIEAEKAAEDLRQKEALAKEEELRRLEEKKKKDAEREKELADILGSLSETRNLPKIELDEKQTEEPSSETTPVEGSLDEQAPALEEIDEEEDVEEAVEADDISENVNTNVKSKIPEEYRKLFNDFVGTGSMEEDIAVTLDNLIHKFTEDGTSKTNNVIITGSAKIGKTTLGLSLIKAANRGRNRSGRRVAKVKASALNKRGVATAMTQILGTDLIIEQAGNLMPNTLVDLMIAMKNYTEEMLIILEDDKAAIDRMINNTPDLLNFFTNRLDIHEMEIEDMVQIAKDYAESEKYTIDEIGELALYAKLDDISGRNPVLSIEDIQEVIDDAIEHANKFSLGKLFGRRRAANGEFKILTEQDFM